jgi:RNA polymerase sigma-70 factor (ECF subfamily)
MATHLQPVRPSTVPPEEVDLVRRAQAGEMAAFEAIVGLYERRIYRLLAHMLGDAGDAEDALQETFLRVYSKLHQFQLQSRLYTWIVRIAVNQALMKLRQRRSGRTVPLDQEIATEEGPLAREFADWHPNPEEQYRSAELNSILQRALDSLSWPYRIVFQLRDVEELSTQETAEALGLTEAAVKSRLLRARLQLRDKLTRHFRLQPS